MFCARLAGGLAYSTPLIRSASIAHLTDLGKRAILWLLQRFSSFAPVDRRGFFHSISSSNWSITCCGTLCPAC